MWCITREKTFVRVPFFWVAFAATSPLKAQNSYSGTLVEGKARGFAQVGEWLKPTDCKSVPPSEVRRFESSPVHQFEALCGRERSGSPQPKSRTK
jgi:hypothetical protein